MKVGRDTPSCLHATGVPGRPKPVLHTVPGWQGRERAGVVQRGARGEIRGSMVEGDICRIQRPLDDQSRSCTSCLDERVQGVKEGGGGQGEAGEW